MRTDVTVATGAKLLELQEAAHHPHVRPNALALTLRQPFAMWVQLNGAAEDLQMGLPLAQLTPDTATGTAEVVSNALEFVWSLASFGRRSKHEASKHRNEVPKASYAVASAIMLDCTQCSHVKGRARGTWSRRAARTLHRLVLLQGCLRCLALSGTCLRNQLQHGTSVWLSGELPNEPTWGRSSNRGGWGYSKGPTGV